MKISDLKQKLHKERPMSAVTLRMPEDVVENLKRLAPLLGFTGYQPLMRAYIGQGMRADLERLEGNPEVVALLERLRLLGVSDDVINQAFQETFYRVSTPVSIAMPVQAYTPLPYELGTTSGLVLAEEKPVYETNADSEEIL